MFVASSVTIFVFVLNLCECRFVTMFYVCVCLALLVKIIRISEIPRLGNEHFYFKIR